MESLQREIQAKEEEIRRMRVVGQDKFAIRESQILNLSMIINQLGDGDMAGLNVEQIFLGDGENAGNRRRSLNELLACLRFLYTTDILAPLSENERRIVEENTPDWNIAVE